MNDVLLRAAEMNERASALREKAQKMREEAAGTFEAFQKRIDVLNKDALRATEEFARAKASIEAAQKGHDEVAKTFETLQQRSGDSETQTSSPGFFEKFLAFAEKVRATTENMKPFNRRLAKRGWFLDNSKIDIHQMSTILGLLDTNPDELDEALLEYLREHEAAIRDKICAQYPGRAKVLRSAFQAHERGEYELSVPVFFAQADGICQEEAGGQLFQQEKKPRKGKKRRRLATAVYVDGNDTLIRAMMINLIMPGPIAASSGRRRKGPKIARTFNRHRILHGEDSDYGTEENSLRAISLLSHVGFVFTLPARTKSRRTSKLAKAASRWKSKSGS
ncbi:MAG: hypothetical protein HY292_01330 [Planctomycetes bacterium]|nr:hypothetical protein [Planctomycetota bacterium]